MILVQLLVVHRPFDRPSHSSSKASLIELETDGGVGCDEAVYGFGYEMEDDPQPLVEALERNLLANEVDEFVHGELGGVGEKVAIWNCWAGKEIWRMDWRRTKAACTFATRRSTLLIASRALRGRTLVPLSLRSMRLNRRHLVCTNEHAERTADSAVRSDGVSLDEVIWTGLCAQEGLLAGYVAANYQCQTRHQTVYATSYTRMGNAPPHS